MWDMPLKERWRLYRRWVWNASQSCHEKISVWQEKFDKRANDLKEVRMKEDYEVLRKADVIGMTTTGNVASRNEFCCFSFKISSGIKEEHVHKIFFLVK